MIVAINRSSLLMKPPSQEVIDSRPRRLLSLFQLRIIAQLRKLSAPHFHLRREALLKS